MRFFKWMLGLAFVMAACPAGAYLNSATPKLRLPVKFVVPHKIVKDSERIYTPDKYFCTMRRTVKYCQDKHGNPLTGKIVNTYNQTVAYETYRSGYQSGVTTIFDESGTLLQKVEYKKGVRHGEAISYYVNGNVEFVAHYDDGALDGRLEQYDINGSLLGKMTYKKGWFKEGYCKNEAEKHSMEERLHHSAYNEVIPCGGANE